MMVTVSRNERGTFTFSRLRTPTKPPTSSEPSLSNGVRSFGVSVCARNLLGDVTVPLYCVVTAHALIAVSGEGSYVSRGISVVEFTLGATKRSAVADDDVMRMPMRRRREPPYRLSSTSFRHAYWTVAQLVAHHTVNGCDLRAGDLLGTGTQSGPTPPEAGSLLELSAGGTRLVQIGPDEYRGFLEDGDTVIFRAWCEGPGAVRIGFGEVQGQVRPAAGEGRETL